MAATGHDRCVVALQEHELEPWLAGAEIAFPRPDGLFRVERNMPNPRGGGGGQLELPGL